MTRIKHQGGNTTIHHEPVSRPVPSSLSVQLRMQRQKSRNTPVEVAFRSLVHRRGLRFLVHRRPLPRVPRTADLVFIRARVAAYVDGCFWHGCPHHYMKPLSNAEYWLPKIERNRMRDSETDSMLRSAGWVSFRVWEHEKLSDAADRLAEIVRQRAIPPKS